MCPVSSRVTPATAVVGRNVRRFRDDHGLSLSGLARRSGIAKATLSAIEAGDGNPTVTTLESISAALGVPLARLVAADDESRVRLIRRDDAEHAGTDDLLVESFNPRGLVEVYDIRYEPGDRIEYPPHAPGFVERVLIHGGRLRAGPVDEPVELVPGDLLAFPADLPHAYEALASGPVRAVLLAVHPRAGAGEDSPIHPDSRD